MRTFQSVDAAGFTRLVQDFPWTRRIVEVHLHHTWRPRQSDYRGLRTIEGMWRTHTEVNKWSDIAQHVSIAPDGTIWVGRNFNWAPASASGFNGNAKAGPFMIEMIGDFDKGREAPGADQKNATLAVIKAVQQHFGLKPEDLRFHNEMSAKSCPGTSQSKPDWIAAIRAFALPAARDDGSRDAFPEQGRTSYDLIAQINPLAPQTDDVAAADHPVELAEAVDGGRDLLARGVDPAIIEALGDHVVNLTQGRFSRSGIIQTDAGDVDRIFDERLAEEIASAKAHGRKARLLVYAHGGLVDEKSAILGAYDQLRFWRANAIFPLFFIWETGLAETLKQMLLGARGLADAPRGPMREWLDDRVEDAARLFGGDKIWSGMKRSAEIACGPDGGATYVAQRIARLLRDNDGDIELHIAGHSAGSIFQTRFLSALDTAVEIRTAHFLAPAMTSALFLDGFAPAVGHRVKHLTLFTMTKTRELADTVTSLYRKSLLYMIYGALEPERDTDILGLEMSLRRDPALRALFGLDGRGGSVAEVVWSPSGAVASGSASNASTHGDFDNDGPTLESVCRRISGKVNGEPIAPYVARRDAPGLWTAPVDLPESLRPYLAAPAAAALPTLPAGGYAPVPQAPQAVATASAPSTGRRKALCFGIDNYPHVSPLAGCINDARRWMEALGKLGFETGTIEESDATAETILRTLRTFITSAQPGDRLVVQYSGHGTLFADADGDERGGDDSALCAFDCNDPAGAGGLVLDDDIYETVKLLPKGVELTLFMDCCHSGTVMRALGAPPLKNPGQDAKPRFVRPSEIMVAAWQAARARRRAASADSARALAGEAGLIGIQFAACQDQQVAYESNGSGHFTTRATKLLAEAQGLTNRAFHDRLIAAFGPNARQEPNLFCDPAAFDRPMAL